ncbi:hypothetical protein ABI59_15550 [Acidobacteria bacterium Mor1]|nr:hypothetical protein ABI59_15550 [Acidobacteria bacterium Mor1]
MSGEKDPTEAMRLVASEYPDVDAGTACTQSSFKARKKAFLFAGPQGGRFKAMFKLEASIPEASRLAEEQPDRFEVGKNSWVTARFSADEPMPAKLWKAWLDESYGLAAGGAAAKPKAAPKTKAAAKKRIAPKK